MHIKSQILLQDLAESTHLIMKQAEELKKLSLAELNWRKNDKSWSILECLEHLNLYGEFYLPEIERRIMNSSFVNQETFKSGLLGNYFAKSMLPKKSLNKMKTFKDKNPIGSKLGLNTIEKFLDQQQRTLQLLDSSKKVDLSKTKTGITISKWIKLRLGDTFRVLVYHNQRHLVQAQNVYVDLQSEKFSIN